MPNTRLIATLCCMTVIAALSCPMLAADSLTRFDFEDGTLQGWTIESGQAGTLPTGPTTARANVSFSQQGKYFIGLYENPKGDEPTIVLKSPVFTIQADTISLLVGGGNHPDTCYVALYKATDNSEIARETGRDREEMARRYWDVSKLKGQRVYIKVVDSNTGGWGHINVDDVREMTPAEERVRAREAADEAKKYERWMASVTAPSKRIVYKGESLKDVAFPLGGIGAGHVSICGDGAVRQWCIFNQVNEACVVPDSFFAIRTRTPGKKPVVRLLQQSPLIGAVGESGGPCCPPGVSCEPGKTDSKGGEIKTAVCPAAPPPVKAVEFVGEYPIAELRYYDKALPVKVSMRAFSPHIPMNSKDSAIPAAVFEFTIENKVGVPVEICLLSALQNAVGYDGLSAITGHCNKDYGGNVNTVFSQAGLRGVLLANPSLQPDARQFGTMAIGARHENCRVIEQWDDCTSLWKYFTQIGMVGSQGGGPSADGRTWNSGVVVPVVLYPKQKVTIPVIWSWHFPNMHNVWQGGNEGYVGRMYSNWFSDASKAAGYLSENYELLSADTRKFRDTFYKTTLPYYMLDRISAQSSTLVSTVCMWNKDGSFAAFEGAGCCPMNCNHVWNYEQQMAHLFPDLERNMRNIDLTVQETSDGAIRHRTRFPLTEPREQGPVADGQMGTILKAYREYRQSTDKAWLQKMWPNIKLAMQYCFKDYDPNKDGVIVNWQWNTYDCQMPGPNTFVGAMYLAALRASEEMAKVVGDQDFAKDVRAVYDSGTKRLDEALWTGEYWKHIEAKPKPEDVKGKEWLLEDWPDVSSAESRPYANGCHADQLLGQWWATMLDLGYVLPKDRVNTALDSIMKFNWVKDFGEARQWPRAFVGAGEPGLYISTWPYGGKPDNEIMYSFEDWTGINYEVAGLLIQEGKINQAYQIVKACSDRYNGVPRWPIQRNPWAEVECSNHYARAMASWGMLLAAQGYCYCGPDQAIEFNPTISPENHTSFFTGAEGWGLFTQKRGRRSQENTLAIEYGKLALKTLTLTLPEAASPGKGGSFEIKLDQKLGSATQTFDGGRVTLHLDEPVTIVSGERVSVRFAW